MNEFTVDIRYAYCDKRLSIDHWSDLRDEMPKNIKQRIDRYRRWQDRQAVLFGKILLRNCLTEYGYPSECLEMLRIDEWGRLYLDGGIDFNISHSGGCVVCAASRRAKVGIDIEEIRGVELDDFTEHFSSEEWRFIVESPDPNRAFHDRWTRKESVLKADGRGLSVSLATVSCIGDKAVCSETVWFLREIHIRYGYSCHLATNVDSPDIVIEKVIIG